MKERIRIRRDSLSNWNFHNPILGLGEAAYVTDTNKLKIGNGVTNWSGLPYLVGGRDAIEVLKIGDGSFDTLSWETSDRLNFVGSGGTSVFFDPPTNRIIFFSSNSLDLTKSNITGILGYLPQPTGSYSVSGHTHSIGDITNLQNILDTKQSTGIYASGNHQHQISDVVGLSSALNQKQPLGDYSESGHIHQLYINNGSNRVITYNSNEDLKIVGSGNTYIGFNDTTNTITIGSIYQNPGSNFSFITVTGNIPFGQTTPTNIKFSYPNAGVDDITTVDGLLKRLVDTNNSGITKNVVTITGSQNISGLKSFLNKLTVNNLTNSQYSIELFSSGLSSYIKNNNIEIFSSGLYGFISFDSEATPSQPSSTEISNGLRILLSPKNPNISGYNAIGVEYAGGDRNSTWFSSPSGVGYKFYHGDEVFFTIGPIGSTYGLSYYGNAIPTLANKITDFTSISSSDFYSKITDKTGSGIVVFNTNPVFSGSIKINNTGVSISGHKHNISDILDLSNNIVYTSGNQTISGTKIFTGSGVISTGVFSEIILTSGQPFNSTTPATIKFGNGMKMLVFHDTIKFEGLDQNNELLTINSSGISTPNIDNSQIHGGYF